MKIALMLAFAFASAVMAPAAFAHPLTLDMSCAEAKATVDSEGAIVLRTGLHTYDRFVAHQGYCMRSEVTKPAWVPTNDSAQCFVGYTCGQRNGGR